MVVYEFYVVFSEYYVVFIWLFMNFMWFLSLSMDIVWCVNIACFFCMNFT